VINISNSATIDLHPYSACLVFYQDGSALSALLFMAHVAPVGDFISTCGVEYHQYADDVQLYFIAVRASSLQSDLSVVEVRSTTVKQHQFAMNDFLLNADKVSSHLLWHFSSTHIASSC